MIIIEKWRFYTYEFIWILDIKIFHQMQIFTAIFKCVLVCHDHCVNLCLVAFTSGTIQSLLQGHTLNKMTIFVAQSIGIDCETELDRK